MKNSIKCPHCGQTFEPGEAFRHEIEEKIRLSVKAEKDKEIDILKKRAEEAEGVELKLRKEKAVFEEEKHNFELKIQRQLAQERDKIVLEARKQEDEKNKLVLDAERKKNEDFQKQIEDLQRKLQQGSQQTQGEVMELELEELLKREFPEDRIEEVKKGERGADVMQTVIDKLNRECGMILWESKNAQWSDGWLKKLREDQREAGAPLAVLVASNPPKDVETFVFRENIWICSRKAVKALAMALRFDLVRVNMERLANVGKSEKMEVLYQYLRSVEFSHRIEGIVEAFNNLQEDIEKEKRFFNTKWSRQEKELRKIIDNTHGMYGDLQAVTGRELQEIKMLENQEIATLRSQ